MSEQNKRHTTGLLPSFAGIALADILANGVAMIIILIVITITVKHQQEQERISEFEEVSVLLSRDIASSVVMNDLPTSAPAVLHDYHNSPLDRIPDPRILPIIELHKGFVRDFYTRKTFTREELLQQDNDFDNFIKAMDPFQKSRIRIDVYDVNMFYIAMSILKKYGRLPAHWHFIGYGKPGGADAKAAQKAAEPESEVTQPDSEPAEPSSTGSAQEVWESFPDGAQIQAQSDSQQYPFDDLAYDSEASLAGGQQAQKEPQTPSQIASQMFETLLGMMGSGSGSMPKVVRFRTAKPSSSKSDADKNSEMLEFKGDSDSQLAVDYIQLMVSLFRFMEKADRAAQNGDYSVLDRFNFQKDIIIPAINIVMPKDPQQAKFFLNLATALSTVPQDANPLRIDQKKIDIAKNSLQITPNQPLKMASLLTNPDQKTLNFLPGEASIRLNLGLYPAIYKGLVEPVSQANMLLMPQDKLAPSVDRWRVAAIISPKRGDYLLSFVYGHFITNGDLVIASDENAVQIDQFHTYTFQPPIEFRKQKESFLIFGIFALLLLFGIIRRFRKVS